MSLFDRDKSGERLPVSLITGFLGSGKTTLLNKLLRHAGMADSAVIINEFGEVGLDHLLVEAVDGEVAVLASGCICCTMRSDLEETLRRLLAQRDRGEIPQFQRVLVETTGLADPAPIVQLLLNNPLLSHFVRLDTVVTTVDAVHGERQLDAQAEAVKQVAIADRLLLTKTDIAEADAVEPLRKRLDRLNPGATLTTVLNGAIEPEALFGAALFDPARKTADVRRWLNEEAYRDAHPAHDHGHDHAHGIDSFCLTVGPRARLDDGERLAERAAPPARRASAARQGHPASCRRRRPGRHPRRASRVPSARAAERADRRSALAHRVHHARPRPGGSRSRLAPGVCQSERSGGSVGRATTPAPVSDIRVIVRVVARRNT